jgi:hypothetical protein
LKQIEDPTQQTWKGNRCQMQGRITKILDIQKGSNSSWFFVNLEQKVNMKDETQEFRKKINVGGRRSLDSATF